MSQPVYFTMNTAVTSPWINTNYHAQPFSLSIGVTVTGTINYTVQYTYDKPWAVPDPSSWSPTAATVVANNDAVLAASTASGDTTYNDPIAAWRVVVNTVSGGSIAVKGIQAGIRG